MWAIAHDIGKMHAPQLVLLDNLQHTTTHFVQPTSS